MVRIVVTGNIAAGKSLATSYVLEWLSEHLDCNPPIRRIDTIKSSMCVAGGKGDGMLYRVLPNGSVEYLQPDILLPKLLSLLLSQCEEDLQQHGFILECVQTELWRAATEDIGPIKQLLENAIILVVHAPKHERVRRNGQRSGIHHIPDHVLEKQLFNRDLSDEQCDLFRSKGAHIFHISNEGSPAELHAMICDIMADIHSPATGIFKLNR